MKQNKTSKKLVWTGILTAIASSLCCITPVLALIAGSSGIASTFSWLEPARPYLIGITIVVLSFAWYQKLKPKKQIECDCETNENPSFIQSKTFLFIVTLFAAVMLAFPYYSHIFYPKTKANVIIVDSNNIQQANFEIAGMTCTGCEEHIKHAVSQLPGYIDAQVNHKTGKAIVKFDKSKNTMEDVTEAINKTGYTVVNQQLIQN